MADIFDEIHHAASLAPPTATAPPKGGVHYIANGESYDIPRDKTLAFLKDFPKARRSAPIAPTPNELLTHIGKVTHPLGDVTGIDAETGLPIVKRMDEIRGLVTTIR